MTTTPSTPALRLGEDDDLDLLATYASTTIRGANLKPGMVLLDDLDTPAAVVDHRIAGKAGTIRYLVNDVEAGGWTEARIGENAAIKVAAR